MGRVGAALIIFAALTGCGAQSPQLPVGSLATPSPAETAAESGTPTLAATTTAQATPQPSPDCQPVGPSQLPDGSPAGGSREIRGEIVDMWEWGEGDNSVTQAINHPSYWGAELPHPDLFEIEVRGEPAVIVTVGDSTLSQITITWVEGGCTYTIWIGPGIDVDEASEYASRY